MPKYQLLKYLTNLFILFIFWSCLGDAPRNNPLDPSNNNSTLSELNGKVLTYRVPHLAIPGVKVTWVNDKRFTYTDTKGNYSFKDISEEAGWLFFESPSFLPDSIYIDPKITRNGFERYLNARPVLDDILFYSSIRNDYPDRQIISLNLLARISDPDNDIDSVLVISEALNLKTYMDYDISKKIFQRKITTQELNINTPEKVIGHSFKISVKDNFGNEINLADEVVKRIIKEEVSLDSPGNIDTVTVTPTLKWTLIDPGFQFNYMVEIYTDDINQQLVWSKEDISSTTASISVDQPLGENRYFWIVWIVDEFQNRSASKPKKFYAKNF